jgi:Phytanoyl-CoA dioxygenase (PhyH)
MACYVPAMRILKRGDRKQGDGGTAVADQAETKERTGVVDDFAGTDAELSAEIDRLAEADSANPDRQTERRLLALRHIAGIRALKSDGQTPDFPAPDSARLPADRELPEFRAAELTPELLRAAILRDGFILVRGLVDRDAALRFGEQIDRAFAEREKFLEGQHPAEGYYEEFLPGTEEYEEALSVRPWIREGGGVLAVDSPMLSAVMVALFKKAGVPKLAEGYLGETPLISLQKTTLRKAEPHVPGAWHQDGSFMGDVRALNLWLSLSRCGDESPGLDMVPRRLDYLVTQQTEEAVLSIQVSQKMAEDAAGDREIIRPIFEPGDALFFDDLFLHQTGSDPSMPKPRYAVENWFFGASGFPVEYGPIAV